MRKSIARRQFLSLGLAAALPAERRDVRGYGNLPVAIHPAMSPQFDSRLFDVTSNAAGTAFTLGVASGDPKPNGIVLWTRVAPEAIGPWPIAFQIATGPFFFPGAVVLAGILPVSRLNDGVVKAVVQADSLRPFTTYYYRFIYNGATSRAGRFKTLPVPGAAVSGLRIGFVSCQDFTNGYYTSYAAMLHEDLDYVVHLGDYIYESGGSAIQQREQARPIGPLPSGNATAATLEDYRFLYRTYRGDLNLQLVHERFAFIQIWDDHEFANDGYQDFHPDDNPAPLAPAPALRQAASQAWTEFVPTSIAFDPVKPPLESVRLYRSFVFGDLAELVATDERLYRGPHACGEQFLDRYATAGCSNLSNPGRSMFGIDQRDWFVERMKSSQAIWKLWANEVMAMPLKIVDTSTSDLYLSLDMWDGFPAEREYLLRQLSAVKNVVALTGDIHSFAAGYLRTDFGNPFSPATAVEFVGGSVSSANFFDTLSSLSEPVSSPVPKARLAATRSDLFGFLLQLSNPHLQYFNSSTHGYCVLEIGRSQMVCRMMSVGSIRQQVSPASVLARFLVPRNLSLIIPF